MAFIIHDFLHDRIDYANLIEAQAKHPAFEPKKVVGAKRKYYDKNSIKSTKRDIHRKMLKK